jgi:2-oxoglutarate dehydrogenase E1 component
MWQDDPHSVHASWQVYFARLQDRKMPVWEAFTPPPGFLSSRHKADPRPSVAQTVLDKRSSVQLLVSAYRTQGHRHADLNPLDPRPRPALAELDPAFYGLTQHDMDREFALGPDLLPGFIGDERQSLRLRDIIDACRSTYCLTYGVEWQHITDSIKREWLRQRLEVPTPFHFTKAEKQTILHEIMSASMLERFLGTKYPSEKRFGLDGAEALAPAMTTLIDRSADVHGVDQVVIGSCHRGRLTMMGSVYGKPLDVILAEFAGKTRFQLLPGMTGDVKSHLGVNSTRATGQGRQVSLSLLANPSHLEAVDPIAGGKTRATQRLLGDTEHKHVLCVTLHGDAAFAGQGVVYETLNMSKVPMYDVGGTIRLVVNNQLGFTADSVATRSTTYCSDIARFIDAPIFHVNGDDPEAVTFVCQLAADWRATFQTDCVVDLICYRRYGHQELDLPDLTQPVMYGKIAKHTPLLEAYASKLLAEGSITHAELDAQQQKISARLNESFSASKDYQPLPQPSPPGWQHLPSPAQVAEDVMPDGTTAVDGGVLNSIARQTMTLPEDLKVHKTLRRIIEARKQGIEQGSVDWATAEALAYDTLCLEGHHVRLTGQDVQRGTFAHRHAVLHDQETGQTWTPLNLLSATQAPFSVTNSPLSEYAPLGVEYGYSLADPGSLVVWEAQFGDFVNNAQVVIDNLLATGEVKWMDRSGLVLLLPHGYDGQGPEHSSARLERFLQLGSEDGTSWPVDVQRRHQDCNVQVTYITSPANLFHVLRRQIHRPYRKRKFYPQPLARSCSRLVNDLLG